jgi:hypothetical protein
VAGKKDRRLWWPTGGLDGNKRNLYWRKDFYQDMEIKEKNWFFFNYRRDEQKRKNDRYHLVQKKRSNSTITVFANDISGGKMIIIDKALKRQEELEAIFHVVDELKNDLNFHSVEIDAEKRILRNDVGEVWEEKEGILYRSGKALLKVTDWFVTGFPDAKSVLYRIGMGDKEPQIRGYIPTHKEVKVI